MKARREGLHTFNVGKGKAAGGGERFYTADDVEALIPVLRRQNARGFDVYVTPVDAAHHYLVVDDMRDAGTALRTAGWTPTLVQSSSPGNWQAVIKAPRVERPDEQSIANSLVQQLNGEFGDPKLSGAVHPFRMAGFSNKKPGKGGAFTKLVEVLAVVCRQAAQVLNALRHDIDVRASVEAEARQARRREVDAAMQSALDADRAAAPNAEHYVDAFEEAWKDVLGWVQQSGWTLDHSRMDWQVTLRMLRANWSDQSVVNALLQASPGIQERHNDPRGYAERTVRNAWRHLEQQGLLTERTIDRSPIWKPPSVA